MNIANGNSFFSGESQVTRTLPWIFRPPVPKR